MQVINCLNCSTPLQETAKFCGNCGAEVLRDLQNPELRVLTVLFVDLVGSTALAQKSELEDYDDTIASFHTLVSNVVEAYRGSVLQRYGDGVLACFGLEHDGEDSALSAIAAGLSIADSASARLSGQNVRVGIDSGQVMCRIGQSGTLYPQLTGLHVNRAARLQEKAQTGGVVISGETRSFLSRIADIDIESEQRSLLKGIETPVDVIAVNGFSFVGQPRHNAPLCDREQELDRLLAKDAPTLALVGPAGIGKSTLIAEVVQKLAPTPIIQIDARANLQQSALFPMVQAVRAELSLTSSTSVADLSSGLSGIGVSLSDTDLQLMAGVLGLREASPVLMTPELQKERRIALMVDILGQLALHRNAIVSFDDLHWADDESLTVLKTIADRPDLPVRMILTSRPTESASSWLEENGVEIIVLNPLSNAAARRALEAFPELTTERLDEIITAAEGNPLFLFALAERARQLGSNADEIPLPQTVEATFQAIITGLGNLKELVLNASVLGREFNPDHVKLLQSDNLLAEDELTQLTFSGFFEKRRDGLAFNHILLRDAAYEMIPRKRRRALHLTFVEQLRQHDPDLCAELPELVADHLLAAKAHDQIPMACIAAGIRMLRSVNFETAAQYLDLAQQDMESEAKGGVVVREEYLTVLSLLASARVQSRGFAHPSVLQSYEGLEAAIAHAKGTDRQRMVAFYGLCAHRIISGHVRSSGEYISQMKTLADRGDDELKILYLVNEAAHGLYSGDFERAGAASAALQDIYDVTKHGFLFLELGADPYASVLSADVHIHCRAGDKTSALATMEKAKQHLNAIGALAQVPWINVFSAQALYAGGYSDLAYQEVQAGIDLADEQRAQFWSLVGRLWSAVFRILDGDIEAAPVELETYIAHSNAIGANLNMPYYIAVLALASAQRGENEQAAAKLKEAEALMHEAGAYQWADEIAQISKNI